MADQSLERFAIPGILRVEPGNGGLTKIVVAGPRSDGELYLHGGHVTRFQPRNAKQPVLFVSRQSHYAAGKAIRGGVPIIFPWFGPRVGHPESPIHGFARTHAWTLESTSQGDAGVTVSLSFVSNEATRKIWPFDFRLDYDVVFGDALKMTLQVTNTSPTPIEFEEALHTYITVGDVRKMRITGLEGVTYFDKADGMTPKPQGDQPAQLNGETDRVYPGTRSTCVVHDPALGREVSVAKENSNSTVVWNPWTEKAKALSDFADDEWPGMVCVETCNVLADAVKLDAGASHAMVATISVVG